MFKKIVLSSMFCVSLPLMSMKQSGDQIVPFDGKEKTFSPAHSPVLRRFSEKDKDSSHTRTTVDNTERSVPPVFIYPPSEEKSPEIIAQKEEAPSASISNAIQAPLQAQTRYNISATPKNLIVMIRTGYIEQVQSILEQKPMLVNTKSDNENTPLHFAVNNQNIPMIKLLLNVPHTDVNPLNKTYNTPLDIAKAQKNQEIIALLLEKGAQTGEAVILSPSFVLPTESLCSYEMSWDQLAAPTKKDAIQLSKMIYQFKTTRLVKTFEQEKKEGR